MEIWKNIEETIGYEVSNYGRVRYYNTIKNITISKTNYCYVYIKGTKKNHLLHRLVAKAFLPNFDSKKMVNHIDFNKMNNHIDNLEMVTNRENQCHSIKSKNKYIGISFHKKLNKWTAQIMINGKLKYIGKYSSDEEAYIARMNYEKENGILNKYL